MAAQMVHNRVEHFYKYGAGDLGDGLVYPPQLAAGICVGLMNGVAYFVLIKLFFFNLAYWTTQAIGPGLDGASQLTHPYGRQPRVTA